MLKLAELEQILVCPKCQGKVVLTAEHDGFICNTCKLKYPIDDEIPVMLIDSAISVELADS